MSSASDSDGNNSDGQGTFDAKERRIAAAKERRIATAKARAKVAAANAAAATKANASIISSSAPSSIVVSGRHRFASSSSSSGRPVEDDDHSGYSSHDSTASQSLSPSVPPSPFPGSSQDICSPCVGKKKTKSRAGVHIMI